MVTKNLSVGMVILFFGFFALPSCGGQTTTAPSVVPTVPTPTLDAPATAVPPTNIPATAASAGSNSPVEYVTALTGGAEQFDRPFALDRDPQGNLYVLIVQQHEIAVLSRGFLHFRAVASLGNFIMLLH
jgi:hypothetical protein